MYLAIMLIVVSILVFYNELNSKMNIAEIALLAIALIAIIRASLNYIQIDNTINEGFTNNTRSRKSGVKSRGNNKNEDNIIISSEYSNEYFDTEKFNTVNKIPNSTKSSLDSSEQKINKDAVNQVNSLLGIGTSKFEDIATTTTRNATTTSPSTANPASTQPNFDNSISSVFRPQIIVGKGANDSLNMSSMNMNASLYDISGGLNGVGSDMNSLLDNAASLNTAYSNDNMTFKNTMQPTTNLWGTDRDNWTQSMNDYNNGRWNPQLYQKPSDYTDYYTPSAYGMSTPTSGSTPTSRSNFEDTPTTTSANNTSANNTSANNTSANNTSANTASNTPTATTLDEYGQPKKLCGAYDDLSMDQAGNLVVQNYTQAKKWYPGYTYVPPVYWDVPQRHVSICQPPTKDYRSLTGLVDRGLPINALELNPNGTQADTEDSVTMTNVGSMLPKFRFQETPFSKPYV